MNRGTQTAGALPRGRRRMPLHEGRAPDARLPVRPVGVDPGAGGGARRAAVPAHHSSGRADPGRPCPAARSAPGVEQRRVGQGRRRRGAGTAARHAVGRQPAVPARGAPARGAGAVPRDPPRRGDQDASVRQRGVGRGGSSGPARPRVRHAATEDGGRPESLHFGQRTAGTGVCAGKPVRRKGFCRTVRAGRSVVRRLQRRLGHPGRGRPRAGCGGGRAARRRRGQRRALTSRLRGIRPRRRAGPAVLRRQDGQRVLRRPSRAPARCRDRCRHR